MKKRVAYNVRLIETDKGLKLGFVHRLYERKGAGEWRDVPEKSRQKLMTKLGISDVRKNA